MNKNSRGSRGPASQPVNLGVQKYAEQLGIDLIVAHADFQNIQGAIGWNCAFVRAVRSGESVINVADGHHLGLDGNLIRIQTERITLSVELLVMRAGNFRNTSEFFGPRDLREKIEAVQHVRFDLAALVSIQTAAGDGKKTNLLGGQVWALRSPRITIGLVRNFV